MRMNKQIFRGLINNEFAPALQVSKWFSSLLIFTCVYIALNIFVVLSFIFSKSYFSTTQIIISTLLYLICQALYFAFILNGVCNKRTILQSVIFSPLIFYSCLFQTVAFFLYVSDDLIQLSLQQAFISNDYFIQSNILNKTTLFFQLIAKETFLYLVLIGSSLFNIILLVYPLFMMLNYSGIRKDNFINYLKIRQAVYEK